MLILALLPGCTTPAPDAATADTGTIPTTSTPTADTAPTDTGLEAVPRPGFGTISGDCGLLDDEWTTDDPAFFRNALDLTGLSWEGRASPLSDGARQILSEGTRGGSSGESEAIAFDVLSRCEPVSLLNSETTIVYLDDGGKKTDFRATIDDVVAGVSVTRAMTFASPTEPCGTPDPTALAELVERKVGELPLSEANADPETPWTRSLLAVIACDAAHADLVRDAWDGLDTRGDAILLLTVTDGPDLFLYQ